MPEPRSIGAATHHKEPLTYEVMAPETLQTFWSSGLLHEVNEQVLWPLGLALTLVVEESNGPDRERLWPTAVLRFDTLDEPVVSGLDEEAHKAIHVTIDETKAERARVLGTDA